MFRRRCLRRHSTTGRRRATRPARRGATQTVPSLPVSSRPVSARLVSSRLVSSRFGSARLGSRRCDWTRRGPGCVLTWPSAAGDCAGAPRSLPWRRRRRRRALADLLCSGPGRAVVTPLRQWYLEVSRTNSTRSGRATPATTEARKKKHEDNASLNFSEVSLLKSLESLQKWMFSYST